MAFWRWFQNLALLVKPHYLFGLLFLYILMDDEKKASISLKNKTGLNDLKLKVTPSTANEVLRHHHYHLAAARDALINDIGGVGLAQFKVPYMEAQLNFSGASAVERGRRRRSRRGKNLKSKREKQQQYYIHNVYRAKQSKTTRELLSLLRALQDKSTGTPSQ
ncbi:hypothetical protein AAFF_G00364790 [Aldrovandia affinis]|uniref:Uncharacterized protein n=1 Tax=Aldrovandia affinis TaxID=143900 RepID=A0AAD7WMY1_9TELE|nr:hypothetical protein AAFF_G00364790 [Aldrovandia affinis]